MRRTGFSVYSRMVVKGMKELDSMPALRSSYRISDVDGSAARTSLQVQ